MTYCLENLSVQRYLDLALELGLEKNDVERFEANYPGNSKRVLQEIIDLWMNKSDPTWEFLKRVLGKMSMNNIASTI